MGQPNFALDQGGTHPPTDVDDQAESHAPPRRSWLVLVLMIAMIGSFALVWFLSTPR
jgi:hypothetical protein